MSERDEQVVSFWLCQFQGRFEDGEKFLAKVVSLSEGDVQRRLVACVRDMWRDCVWHRNVGAQEDHLVYTDQAILNLLERAGCNKWGKLPGGRSACFAYRCVSVPGPSACFHEGARVYLLWDTNKEVEFEFRLFETSEELVDAYRALHESSEDMELVFGGEVVIPGDIPVVI